MTRLNILLFASSLLVTSYAQAKLNPGSKSGSLYLIENKGQVTDQYHNTRTDIQFLLPAPGISIFIGSGQMHYQFSKTTVHDKDLPGHLMKDFAAHKNTVTAADMTSTVEAYRMDVELVGANKNAKVTASGAQAYYENYFPEAGPVEGIQAHTFSKITYNDVYPDIDWVIYIKDNKLEHEFVVGPNGNASNIKLNYSGQTSLRINMDGSMTAITPMGTIKEHAPFCFRRDGSKVSAGYRVKGTMLSYNLGATSGLTIDPVLEWGTYYGPDSNNTSQYDMVCDTSGHIYSVGLTWSATTGNVATIGTHQSSYGGNCDAFLIKFDTAGNRIWGTFYGGTNSDWGNGVSLDPAGNVYIVGTTNSTTGISTPGSQQASFGGGWDAFVVRFNSAGIRSWGTYAGASALDYPQSIACDALGHVYIAGMADSPTNIATPGSHMPTKAGGHDDFLIQYDLSGVRQWGTYYGGNSDEFGGVVCCTGNVVFLTGYTSSTTGISTPGGVHQTTLGGTTDVFVARFSTAGVRTWGTYIGGPDPESSGGICTKNSHLYVLANTNSSTGISTPGCHQPTKGGLQDAFLAKINPDAGSLIWSTYFGGPADENTDLSRITCNTYGDVNITGYTASATGIATDSTWQEFYGGGPNDAFFAKFSSGGVIYWSTYFGGAGSDLGRATAFDGINSYVAGQTNSDAQIATPGSFLDTGGGSSVYFQGFIAKFIINDTVMLPVSVSNTNVATSEVSVYPNPTHGSFVVYGTMTGEDGAADIVISDVAGKTILHEQTIIEDGKISRRINLPAETPAGVYLLKAISKNKTSVMRFVKE